MQNASLNAQDAEARAQIERELESGEALRWFSRANPEAMARRGRGAGFFGLVLIAMAILIAPTFQEPGLGMVCRLFWGGMGLLLASLPLSARQAAKSTFYGATDRRAIIVQGASSRSVRSWRRGELGPIRRAENTGGTGDVVFFRQPGSGVAENRGAVDFGFYGIHEPALVESMLREIMG